MKVTFNIFDSNTDINLEQEMDTFRLNALSNLWTFSFNDPVLNYSAVSKFNHIMDEMKRNNVDKTKFVYYAIRFMFDRISSHNDISHITNAVQEVTSLSNITLLNKSNGTKVVFYSESNSVSLLKSLGVFFKKVNNNRINADDTTAGVYVLIAYAIDNPDEFIKFVKSCKLTYVSTNLNIYWSLRFKKLKQNCTIDIPNVTFEQIFNMYLLGKQLPSVAAFKQEYTRVKTNYVSISTVLKNWKRKNKKLLSCYINDDEKQYLEYMLLSNTVNYEELKKFIYNK